MAENWTWTAEEWARIVRVARNHRDYRAHARAPGASRGSRKVHAAGARGTALELRQWARVATSSRA